MDALDFFHFVLSSFLNNPFRSFFQSFKKMTLFILKIIHFESFSFVFSVYHYWEKSLERLVKSLFSSSFKQFISLFFSFVLKMIVFLSLWTIRFFLEQHHHSQKISFFLKKNLFTTTKPISIKKIRGGGFASCFFNSLMPPPFQD